MVLTDSQWRAIKRIRWNDSHSRRIRQRIGDDKLVVGFDGKAEHWVIARLCSVTVMTQFGVRTIPTRETAPVVWKHWLDDDGAPLHIQDPRLVPYIQRCDLWRQGVDKYIKQFEHTEWLEDQQEKSEEDDLGYIAKHLAYPRVKEESDRLAGYISRTPVSRKWFEPKQYKPSWEITHDRVAM